MRRHPLLLVIAVVILALGATPALATLAPLGGPLASHSWSQRFEESGVGNYDHLQLHMISGPPFALPAAQSGFSVSGWAQGFDDGSDT